jgi:ketosteroid isomerase-like protein
MKTKVVKGLLLSCAMLLAIACNTKKTGTEAAAVDVEQIKKEIQAKEDEFAATYNAGERKTLGYYADDAISFSQNSAPHVGKAAIIEYLMANIDSGSNYNKISYTTKEVFVSNDANQVVEIGYYTVVDSTNTPVNTGNYMVLFVKRDGKYVCLREMSASDLPLQ